MRSAPPLQLTVNHYHRWRLIVALLASSACAAMFAWWSMQPLPVPLWASAVTVAAVLASAICAASLWRIRPLTLRWDRQRWLVTGDGDAERGGELAVAVDLGTWVLLRFVPEGPGPGGSMRLRPLWIALQRSGLEAQWHALRCALYAARPPLPSGGGASDV